MVILVYTFHKLDHKELSVGFYLLFVTFSGILINPISQLISMGGLWQQGIVAAQRIAAVTGVFEEKEGCLTFPGVFKEITFNNVSFCYPSQNNVFALKNITLSFPRGSDSAIVGESGSGKSTLSFLLMRLWEPSQGSITIDNTPLTAFSITSLRNAIGILTQDAFIFNGSIAENINPSGRYPIALVLESLKKAQLPQFIEQYDYQTGERGEKLSGGERQRVALARLLVRNLQVIIFDEATANIDPPTELLIINTLEALKSANPQLTIIVITHRLNWLKDKEKIVVIDKGTIIETGSHYELYRTDTRYWELFKNISKDVSDAK
jgi:ABC-type multidrug transport system fused ATPase/permease subunit